MDTSCPSTNEDFLTLQESIIHPVREQILVLDTHLRVKSASKSFYDAFQVPTDQTIGKQLADLGNGQWNIPALLTRLNELSKVDGEFDDFKIEHDFPALGRRTMLIGARRLSGDDAQSGTILLSIRDITGQKGAEEKIHVLLTRYRALTSIGKAVIITDSKSRITFMNLAAEKLTRWGQNDALQKPLMDIFHIVNDKTSQMVENPGEKVIRESAVVDLPESTVLIARDGGEWPIDGNAAPILDAAGRAAGVVLVFHDISNRRKAEKEKEISEVRYRRLFESAHDGILILDAVTTKVLDVNPFMGDLLGYPREHFLGKELWEIGVFKDAEMSKRAMATLQRLGRIRYEDLPLQHKDGRHIPVEFVSNVYREGRQNVIQCNIRDITERKRLTQNLTKATRDADAANRSKSEFLANMSHEIRTPMNAILGMTELAIETPGSDEQRQYLTIVKSSADALLGIINDLLDFSKIEAGKLDVHPGPVGLDRVRTNLQRTFEPVADDKDLRFTVTLAPGVPASIETDANRLEQVLKNLVSNALKFTERGEVAVEISARPEGVAFAVRDTGIGIPHEQHDMIFEAFRQADGTTNRKFGGTGLGLSISRELARLLGGEIAVTSEVGRGSTFVLTLPTSFRGATEPVAGLVASSVRTPAPSVRAPSSSARPHATNGVASATPHDDPAIEPGDRLVLVVEDDEGFGQALAAVAEEAGFKSVIATTGREGLRLAKKYSPMGIVLDIKLPDCSGLSVLDRLKRDPTTRHVPVHVISATDFTEAALSMGAVAYLMKPVQRDQLVQALKTLEDRSDHRARRVLVVEDDTELRESVAKLLERSDVEITTAANAEDALGLLRNGTFDCVVTDLGMPGASGYDLIETMATQERSSVPPVIVYTGRALSAAEEQRLRRHSKSIIVKGARSPERLLDEVTLFLHQVEAELPPEQQRLLKDARHREAIFEGRTILVVEDDVRNVFAITSVLEPKGARVSIARNGKEALAALSKEPSVDLVLMDIMMPEMDGLEASREIRKNPAWSKLPIIALTAKAMRDDQEKCLAAGANDYLAKPLDIEMLLSLLRVWMPKT